MSCITTKYVATSGGCYDEDWRASNTPSIEFVNFCNDYSPQVTLVEGAIYQCVIRGKVICTGATFMGALKHAMYQLKYER